MFKKRNEESIHKTDLAYLFSFSGPFSDDVGSATLLVAPGFDRIFFFCRVISSPVCLLPCSRRFILERGEVKNDLMLQNCSGNNG